MNYYIVGIIGEYQGKINMQCSNYWDKYYLKELDSYPSDFAIFCLKNYLIGKQNIVDAGCGAGQDSIFFYKNNLQVIGIDNSKVVIDKLQKKYSNVELSFVFGDISKSLPLKVDNIYSRWSLHAMSWKMANCFLKNIYNSLNFNGKLFIECRSSLDIEAKKNISHYRNFINIGELEKKSKH